MVDVIDYTDKEQIKQLPVTLSNLVKVCKLAFDQIEKTGIQGKGLILALGNTGCGKSTMISSLVFGAKRHEVKKVKQTTKDKNG